MEISIGRAWTSPRCSALSFGATSIVVCGWPCSPADLGALRRLLAERSSAALPGAQSVAAAAARRLVDPSAAVREAAALALAELQPPDTMLRDLFADIDAIAGASARRTPPPLEATVLVSNHAATPKAARASVGGRSKGKAKRGATPGGMRRGRGLANVTANIFHL